MDHLWTALMFLFNIFTWYGKSRDSLWNPKVRFLSETLGRKLYKVKRPEQVQTFEFANLTTNAFLLKCAFVQSDIS